MHVRFGINLKIIYYFKKLISYQGKLLKLSISNFLIHQYILCKKKIKYYRYQALPKTHYFLVVSYEMKIKQYSICLLPIIKTATIIQGQHQIIFLTFQKCN